MLQKRHRFVFAILGCSVMTYFIMTVLVVLEHYNTFDGQTLSVLKPNIQAVFSTAPWVLLLVQLVLCAVLIARKKILWCTFIILGFPSWLVGSLVVAFMYEPAPWMLSTCEVAADQQRYCFGESSFLQGQRLVLLQQQDPGALTDRYRVVVRTHGDSPRFFKKVVLPKTQPARCKFRLCVYLSKDKTRLVATRYANVAYIAYDVNSKVAWGNGSGQDKTRNIKKLPETYLSTGLTPK